MLSVFLLIVMLRNGARGEPALDQIRLAAAAAAIALVPYILSRALQEMLRSAAGVTTQATVLALVVIALGFATVVALGVSLVRQEADKLAIARSATGPAAQAEPSGTAPAEIPSAPESATEATVPAAPEGCRTMSMIGNDVLVYCAEPMTSEDYRRQGADLCSGRGCVVNFWRDSALIPDHYPMTEAQAQGVLALYKGKDGELFICDGLSRCVQH